MATLSTLIKVAVVLLIVLQLSTLLPLHFHDSSAFQFMEQKEDNELPFQDSSLRTTARTLQVRGCLGPFHDHVNWMSLVAWIFYHQERWELTVVDIFVKETHVRNAEKDLRQAMQSTSVVSNVRLNVTSLRKFNSRTFGEYTLVNECLQNSKFYKDDYLMLLDANEMLVSDDFGSLSAMFEHIGKSYSAITFPVFENDYKVCSSRNFLYGSLTWQSMIPFGSQKTNNATMDYYTDPPLGVTGQRNYIVVPSKFERLGGRHSPVSDQRHVVDHVSFHFSARPQHQNHARLIRYPTNDMGLDTGDTSLTLCQQIRDCQYLDEASNCISEKQNANVMYMPTSVNTILSSLPIHVQFVNLKQDATCYAERYPDLYRGYCQGNRTKCRHGDLYRHFQTHGSDLLWGCCMEPQNELPSTMAVTPISNLKLCQPFFKAKHGNLTLTIVEAEQVSSGYYVTFFVEKNGIDSSDPFAVASLGRICKEVLHLPLKLLDPTNNRPVDCVVTTPRERFGRLECAMEHAMDEDNPGHLTLLLKDTRIQLDLCKDPPPPRRENVSLAVCVRPFSSTIHGTDTVAVTPEHVTRWLDHQVKLGFERIYLYERKKGELSAILEPYMAANNSSVRDLVDVTYVERISDTDMTYDLLETKSYVYDQLLVMQSCFAKARIDKLDYVMHIDYDEYLHVDGEGLTLHKGFQGDAQRCPSAVSVKRCNIPRVRFDVPVVSPDSVCSDDEANIKTAFNATFMALPHVYHNAHLANHDMRCDSKVLLIHHLSDAYANRSGSAAYVWAQKGK